MQLTLDPSPDTLCPNVFFHCVFECSSRLHSTLAGCTRLPNTLECIRCEAFWESRVYPASDILPDTLDSRRIHSIRPDTFYFGRIHSSRVYSAGPKTLAAYTRFKKTLNSIQNVRRTIFFSKYAKLPHRAMSHTPCCPQRPHTPDTTTH
jgi:hypothetical protein